MTLLVQYFLNFRQKLRQLIAHRPSILEPINHKSLFSLKLTPLETDFNSKGSISTTLRIDALEDNLSFKGYKRCFWVFQIRKRIQKLKSNNNNELIEVLRFNNVEIQFNNLFCEVQVKFCKRKTRHGQSKINIMNIG